MLFRYVTCFGEYGATKRTQFDNQNREDFADFQFLILFETIAENFRPKAWLGKKKSLIFCCSPSE